MTENERLEKMRKLDSYLANAGERFKMIESMTKNAVVDPITNTVKLDSSAVNKAIAHEPRVVRKPPISISQQIQEKAQGGARLRATTPDQINLLLKGKVGEAKKIAGVPQQGIVNEHYEPQQQQEYYYDNPEIGGYEQSKKLLKEEIINELINDKDIRVEIMETIIFELFGKERIKKILKEILLESKQAKK